MAINDISLTSGMRSNLLSLQNTVTLLERTQNRLSTGNKVNTALDNPTSYFASQVLNSRASKIDGLKDGMGQAIQTVQAADKGIKAITSMIEQAKGVAQSAQSAVFTAPTVNLTLASVEKFVAQTVSLPMTSVDAGTASYEYLTIGTVVPNANLSTFTVGGVTFTATMGLSTGASAATTNLFHITGVATTDALNLATQISANATVTAAGYGASVNALNSASMTIKRVRLTGGERDMISTDVVMTGVTTFVTTNGIEAATLGDTIQLGGITFAAVYDSEDVGALEFYAGGTDAEDAAALAAKINANTTLSAAGWRSSTPTATNNLTISKDNTSVVLADIVASNTTAMTTAIQTAEVAGDSITFGTSGVTLTAGTSYNVDGDDTADATALAAAINANTTLADLGWSATSSAAVVNVKYSLDSVPTGITGADITGTHAKITEADIAAAASELSNLQDQYNQMRTQITAVANDSGYRGKNLINGTALTAATALNVKFEGVTLAVTGSDSRAAGLGVTAAAWRTLESAAMQTAIAADIDKLDAALTTLRQNATNLSGNLSIITVRLDFSTNMINTLTEGSNKLTLADTNEEGANMLMLQTRQSLSTTALSLSAQAAQSVLRLFQ